MSNQFLVSMAQLATLISNKVVIYIVQHNKIEIHRILKPTNGKGGAWDLSDFYPQFD